MTGRRRWYSSSRGVVVAPPLLGDGLHRLMYRLVALGGGRIQAGLLRHIFDLHHREPDRWSYETSPYERERLAAVLGAIGPGPYERVLEVGCSEGVFTLVLASDDRVGTVTAADVSPRALETAPTPLRGPVQRFVRSGECRQRRATGAVRPHRLFGSALLRGRTAQVARA